MIDPDYYKQIHGWFDFDNIYEALVAEVQQQAIFVEVGSWAGRSTAFMASRIALSGKPVRFFTIDPWIGFLNDGSQASKFPEFLVNMLQGGLADFVVPLRMLSIEAGNLFPPASVDFCFIDGDHSYEAVRTDLAVWFPKIKVGGVIAGHDYNSVEAPGVKRAVDEFFGGPVFSDRSSWIVRKQAPPAT
jgi:predicted O-methyltransferase YrrM